MVQDRWSDPWRERMPQPFPGPCEGAPVCLQAGDNGSRGSRNETDEIEADIRATRAGIVREGGERLTEAGIFGLKEAGWMLPLGRLVGKVGQFLRFGRNVPDKAVNVLSHVRQHGKPPPGYVGGRVFQNRERRLPVGGRYREYDVDPASAAGGGRNAERIVVDETSGRAWYTSDHYRTFTEMP